LKRCASFAALRENLLTTTQISVKIQAWMQPAQSKPGLSWFGAHNLIPSLRNPRGLKIKMSSKNKKDKRSPRPLPRRNQQIPNSQIRPFGSIGISPYLLKAREYPLHGCWIMANWQEMGITPVVVARKQDNGRILFGMYMVDFYCLGVKDAYTRTDYSLNRFERELPKLCIEQPAPCTAELAHELIYGALEYAHKLGFEPHADFYQQKADLVLDPPDAHPRVNKLKFGKDGKPFYISGPYDSQMKIQAILSTLRRTCGDGNFEFLAEIGGMDDLL